VNRRRDGSLYTEEETITPLLDATGRITHFIGVKQDISARRRAEDERQKLQAQLLQAQKMESVGRLAGGVAHDFNNMLSVILGYTDVALGRLSPSDPLYDDLQEVQRAASRSADLTRQLLAFSRQQTVAPERLDLNDAIEATLRMLRRLIREDTELAWLPGAAAWPVTIDPVQVDQILTNLCVNARDAISGPGRITIETHNVSLDSAYCGKHAGCFPGEYAMLVVSDNGCGMDAEVLEHLYEPFYTTKKAGAGTGLGLAIVYGIVKQNDGFINVYSEPGAGTTFKIYLPRSNDALKPEPRSVEGEPLGHGETLLLVEDEAAILQLVRVMLEGIGYQVLAASTPDEALQQAADHPGTIDLLVTDVVMPGMNGPDLAARLQAARPGLRGACSCLVTRPTRSGSAESWARRRSSRSRSLDRR
jgi:two-component system, cell cycle sensor histidine kinase and response regulator CckA